MAGVPVLAFARSRGVPFANARTKGTPENMTPGAALDLAFAFRLAEGMVANAKSAAPATTHRIAT